MVRKIGPPGDRPKPRPPRWPKPREITDEDREAAFLVQLVQAFKARLDVGEIRKDFFCPLCGSPIVIAREASRGAVRVNCTGPECLSCLE